MTCTNFRTCSSVQRTGKGWGWASHPGGQGQLTLGLNPSTCHFVAVVPLEKGPNSGFREPLNLWFACQTISRTDFLRRRKLALPWKGAELCRLNLVTLYAET